MKADPISLEMTACYMPYLRRLDGEADVMAAQVMAWSAINSGTGNYDGVSRMGDLALAAFAHLGRAEKVSLASACRIGPPGGIIETPCADAIVIRHATELKKRVLLSIHLDTVFGLDDDFQTPWQPDARTLRGPGVADAKGGLAVMLAALTAFTASPYADRLGFDVVLVPDEETGSLSSAGLLRAYAATAGVGMVYEPALPDGTLAGARKGSGNFALVIKGRTAHAGRNREDGRNAIEAAATATLHLQGLNVTQSGFGVNVSRIDGGGALNVVPDLAIVHVNIRCDDEIGQQRAGSAMAQIAIDINSMDGIQAEWNGHFHRPPKPMDPAHKKLFGLAAECGRALNVSLSWKATGGCCDGNNLAACGVPTIDTLGVRGGAIHSADEFALVDSLVERSQLSALLLMRLAAESDVWPC